MLVDDDVIRLQNLSWQIEKLGYDVGMSNATTAMDGLNGFAADVVLVDIQVPAMKGMEVCQAIRANPQLWHLWVVALEDAVTAAGNEAPHFDAQLPKPVNPEALERLLGQFDIIIGRE